MLMMIWCKFRWVIWAVGKIYMHDILTRYSSGDTYKWIGKESALIYKLFANTLSTCSYFKLKSLKQIWLTNFG